MGVYAEIFHNRSKLYIFLLSITSICSLFSSIYFFNAPNLFSILISVIIYFFSIIVCILTYQVLNSKILMDSLVYVLLPLLISFSMGIELNYFIYILWLISFLMINLICVYEIKYTQKTMNNEKIIPYICTGVVVGLIISISVIYFSIIYSFGAPIALITLAMLGYCFSVGWYHYSKTDHPITKLEYIKLLLYCFGLEALKLLCYLNSVGQYHLFFHAIYIVYAIWLILLFRNNLFKYGIIIGLLIFSGWSLPHPHESADFSVDIALISAIILLLFVRAPIIYSVKANKVEFKIVDNKRNNTRLLFSNYVLQGLQYLDTLRRFEPTSYFCKEGPIGQVFQALQPKIKDVAIIGLGTGTLASYGKEGQTFTFYEIEPVVKDIANNYFTYLEDSRAKIEIILGDVRKTLVDANDHIYDIIICDAYIGGDIPENLFTYEAIRLYMSKLVQEGILCLHVTGKSDLLISIVGKILKEAGLFALVQAYNLNKFAENNLNYIEKVGLVGMQRKVERNNILKRSIKNLSKFVEKLTDNIGMVNEKASASKSSLWICAAREEIYLHELVTNPKWKHLTGDDNIELFTDEVIEYNPFLV